MLQDGVFVRGDWIKDKANQATAVKFLRGVVPRLDLLPRPLLECTNIVLDERAGAAGAAISGGR